MFNIDPIGACESEIKDDCEKAILVAQYNSNTTNQKIDFKSTITFIETNFDSIIDYRKSISIDLLGLKDTTRRILNPKYNSLYDKLVRHNLESIKISSNRTIELTIYAVVKPTDSYNYDIKHSIIKGIIPKQKLKDTKVTTLVKHKLISQDPKLYYVIKVVPRFGW